MFRRRPFRRRPLVRRRRPPPSPGAPPHRPPLPPRVLQALARANRLVADEKFVEAANVFGNLSEEAKQRGMLVRTADLALQASRAHFAADDVEAALEWARQALHLFIRSGRVGRVPLVLSKMTTALREKGYAPEADQLEQEAAQALGKMGLSLDEVEQCVSQSPEKRSTLPARCRGCGAPLIPDEVEWHDAHTAECPYCSTIVKAT